MDVSVDSSSPASTWHFPFDWNGWGIGVESESVESEENQPGDRILAWQLEVKAIVDRC